MDINRPSDGVRRAERRSALTWLALAAVVAAGLLAPSQVSTQTATPKSEPTKTAKPYAVPRTPWGDPDLQGVWSDFDETPLEKPNPDPKAAAIEREIAEQRFGGVGKGNFPLKDLGLDSPTSPRRPSLVVDPADGRVPFLPGAAVFRDYDRYADSWIYHTPSERCITRGVPGVILPYAYNNAREIRQTPGYVVIHSEMIHDVRVIRIGGAHVSSAIRSWNGHSVGRWEGETLVVDTTNYNDKGIIRAGEAVTIPQTETLHVVERFTRVSADLIDYKATLEDPRVFARPWTVAVPLNNDPKYQIYEYACHEGNGRFMDGVLSGQGSGRPKSTTDAATKSRSQR